jgi:3-hydroxyisobutyrate dehydrogenase-like beta-hydroxyacid dehydrogenase
MLDKLGFVGFGEAGYHLAKGLRDAGLSQVFAFDINTDAPKLGEKIRARAKETGAMLVDSNAALAEAAPVIIAAVTADQAVNAAAQTAPHLTSSHIYADLNSVSPSTKERVSETVTRAGARFVEIAVMGAVPPYGHKVPMLLGGAAAPEFQSMLSTFGMKMEVVSTDQVGRAVAVKMCRSVVYKGLEAILFECVLAASQYGAEKRVFDSLDESFPGMNWKELADYMVGRVVIHGERRAREMDEVARTLSEVGVEPMMATATSKRMDWAAGLGWKERFGGEFPETYQEVLDVLRESVPAGAKS